MDKNFPSHVKKVVLNGELRVIKTLNKQKIPLQIIKKEIQIHKSITHKFIIQYLGHREELGNNVSLIMEYAEYNVRFLITPEIGMDPNIAHLIFVQLFSAVKYLHSKGICHRDIKPDNILIKKDGNIRLSDFGCSTLFFHKEYRRLKQVVGTYEFMAPEVLKGDYDGPNADIFSMGMSLLNLLTGKLPWSFASLKDERYKAYKSIKYHCYEPFNKIRETSLKLIEGALREESIRIKLSDIENNIWFEQSNNLLDSDLNCVDGSYLKIIDPIITSDLNYTQPDVISKKTGVLDVSQPLQQQNVPSMQRVYIDYSCDETVKVILRILDRMAVMYRVGSQFIVFSTTDSKRNKLEGEIYVQESKNTSAVTFKKVKGDIKEFQKFMIFFNSNLSQT